MLDSLFQGKKFYKIVVFAGVGVLIVFGLISLIILIAGKTPGPRSEETTTKTGNSYSHVRLPAIDFYLEDELQSFFRQHTYPLRDPASVWDKKEVDNYFIRVDEILYEYFQKMNDNYIKEIFSGID
jgi:hypothetical protein